MNYPTDPQVCTNCGLRDTMIETNIEILCKNCGVVSTEGLFVNDGPKFAGDDTVYYGDHHRCAELTTPVAAHKVKIIIRSNNIADIVQHQLGLLDSTAKDMRDIYEKYITSGVKPGEDKHIYIMGVCAYITSEAREAQQICTALGLSLPEFNSTYNLVTNKIKVKRDEMNTDQSIKAVCNKLGFTRKKAMDFRKACLKVYERATTVPHGRETLRQLNTTKLFAVIGILALKMLGEKAVPEEQLNISRPTVEKIKSIIHQLVVEGLESAKK